MSPVLSRQQSPDSDGEAAAACEPVGSHAPTPHCLFESEDSSAFGASLICRATLDRLDNCCMKGLHPVLQAGDQPLGLGPAHCVQASTQSSRLDQPLGLGPAHCVQAYTQSSRLVISP
ncbi:unnamed protein product [Arctogadus glacialis]